MCRNESIIIWETIKMKLTNIFWIKIKYKDFFKNMVKFVPKRKHVFTIQNKTNICQINRCKFLRKNCFHITLFYITNWKIIIKVVSTTMQLAIFQKSHNCLWIYYLEKIQWHTCADRKFSILQYASNTQNWINAQLVQIMLNAYTYK